MGRVVTIYNPTTIDIAVSINNGPGEFQIPGTSSPVDFLPNRPAINPDWNDRMPSPGILSYGDNALNVRPMASTAGHQFTMNIPLMPANGNIQIYLYYDKDPEIGFWALMREGRVVIHESFAS